MNKINIAVWGLGNHAINRILPSISNINEIKLIGVCSRNNNVVNNYAKLYGCYGWNNPTEMLACNKVDVVYISTPIGIHFSNAKQAITAGKNVWCEKPLTCNYKDSVELISLAVERGCIITESFMFLYHPQFKRLKRFVEDSKQIQSIIC